MGNTAQFSSSTKAQDVADLVDLTGKVVFITVRNFNFVIICLSQFSWHSGYNNQLLQGANSGIGKETARALASRGAQVIVGENLVDEGQQSIAP